MRQVKISAVRNQKGISTIELIPILLLFALLFNFSLGFFGIIHSGILNSIAARNYAFETFRNRANFNYLRDTLDSVGNNGKDSNYEKVGFRFHGVVGEQSKSTEVWVATQRPLKFTEVQKGIEELQGNKEDHNLTRSVADAGKASEIFTGKSAGDARSGVSPVWIRTLYGICMNSKCAKP